MPATKLAYYCFVDAGRRHRLLDQKRRTLLLTAQAAQFTFVPFPQVPPWAQVDTVHAVCLYHSLKTWGFGNLSCYSKQ